MPFWKNGPLKYWPLSHVQRRLLLKGSTNPNAPPRTPLIKLLNYKDKAKAMSAAYEKGKIPFDKHRRWIRSAETATELKRGAEPWDRVMEYDIHHFSGGHTKATPRLFTSPMDAHTFLNKIQEKGRDGADL